MRKRKSSKFEVYAPSKGVFSAVSVTAGSNYRAKVMAGLKLGLIKPGIPRYRFTTLARIKRMRKR